MYPDWRKGRPSLKNQHTVVRANVGETRCITYIMLKQCTPSNSHIQYSTSEPHEDLQD